ncbi:MAG TPA: EF-hand domain-containing protein [Phycisphaerales bacterium]|nr:EF-hand domain-containing protein [Phycisphaerales bacterium]
MGISRKMLAAVGCLAAIGSMAQVASAQLSNPGFEDICGPAADWITFGNVSSINFYTTTGTRAIKMYGPFNADPGYSGMFQDAPASEGQVWEASCDATNPFWDSFTWNGSTGSQAFVEIQFLDANDVLLTGPQQYISTKLGANTGESPVALTVSGAVAPAGTAKVRIVMLVEQFGYQGGAVWWDSAVLRQTSGANVLTNDSFESQTEGCVGSPYAHWVNFGNGQANLGENVRTGQWAAKLFGGYNGDPAYSGWYQDVPATPGTKWRARGWANSLPTDLIQDGNEVFVSIEFKDEFGFDLVGGAAISQWVPTGALNTLNYEFYQTGDAIAPDYTAFARIVILQVQHGYVGGATWWDDMSFGCPADVDGTGFVDTDDFDAFVRIFEEGSIEADFDNTGFVDTDDFDAFVRAYEEGC